MSFSNSSSEYGQCETPAVSIRRSKKKIKEIVERRFNPIIRVFK